MPGWLTISDRKSTRLNSSHLGISYAVFCLKKKNSAHRPDDAVMVDAHTANAVIDVGGDGAVGGEVGDEVDQWRYCFVVFFFNDTATTEIYTLSLHDALPI